jgi:hypothetical protein
MYIDYIGIDHDKELLASDSTSESADCVCHEWIRLMGKRDNGNLSTDPSMDATNSKVWNKPATINVACSPLVISCVPKDRDAPQIH